MLTLKRSEATDEREDCGRELGGKAMRLLHYMEATRHHDDMEKSATILHWLLEHDVRPFEARSLDSYMRWQRIKQELKTRLPILAISLVAGIGAAVVGSLTNWGPEGWMGFIGAAVTLLSGLISTAFLVGTFAENGWEWKSYEVGSYDKPIPEFALQTAVDLAEAFPQACNLRVVELVKKESPLTGDPFLALILPGGKRLYLEVWQEPGFKRVREF